MIKCNICGQIYTDDKSIEIAKKLQESWKGLHEGSGIEIKGLCPCPISSCEGELIEED